MSFQGKLQDVMVVVNGSQLEVTTTAIDTVIYLSDIDDFNETGGLVSLGEDVNGVPNAPVTYLAVAEVEDYNLDSEGTQNPPICSMTLSAAVGSILAEGTRVYLYPYSEAKIAHVLLTGNEDEPVECLVPHYLASYLDDGVRQQEEEETVIVDVDDTGDLVITSVVGIEPKLLARSVFIDPDNHISDDTPPLSSPTPDVIGGIGSLFASWDAIINNDLVYYDVYLSTVSGFTPDITTFVGTTTATTMNIRQTASGAAIAYNTLYYIVIIARDEDGSAPTGAQTTASARQADNVDISTLYLYAGTISANKITAGTITTDIILGGKITTSLSGARVEQSASGITVYNSLGAATTILGSDGTSTFNGDVLANTLTAFGKVALRAVDNELAQGAGVIMQQGTTQPVSPLTLSNKWDRTSAQNSPSGGGFSYSESGSAYYYSATGTFYQLYYNYTSSTDIRMWVVERNATTGAIVSTPINAQLMPSGYYPAGVIRIGTNFYVSLSIPGGYVIQKRAVATPTVVAAQYSPALGSGFNVFGWGTAAMTEDAGNILVGYFDGNLNQLRFGTVNEATGAIVTAVVTVSSPPAASGGDTNYWYPTGVWKGTGDLGATRVVMQCYDAFKPFAANIRYFTFQTTGTRDTNAEWATAPSDSSYAGFGFISSNTWRAFSRDAEILTYDGPYWSGSNTLALKATHTWYDSDTTGGSLTHETPQGPITSFTASKRGRLEITAPPIPYDDVNPTNYDDVDSFRVYLGTSTGSRTTQWLNATVAPLVQTVTLTSTLNTTSGTNPPATNNFPSAVPAKILSNAEFSAGVPKILLSGDGSGNVGKFKVNSSGLATQLFYNEYWQDAGPFSATGTSNVTLTGIGGTLVVESTSDVFFAYFDCNLDYQNGDVANVIELLVDGVVYGTAIANTLPASVTGLTPGFRLQSPRQWVLTGLTAGNRTLSMRTRNSLASRTVVVRHITLTVIRAR